jgi:formylmethanofuran dehydrogenase subunit C
MMAAREYRPGIGNEPLAASSRFKGFKPETEQQVRSPEVRIDKTHEMIMGAWRYASSQKPLIVDLDHQLYYSSAAHMLSGKTISADDVVKFNLALSGLQETPDFKIKAGAFLSALVNHSQDGYFVIETRHIDERLEYLGMKNKKNILVKGSVGDSLGDKMSRGIITVWGECGSFAGSNMLGGRIFVKKSAGMAAGYRMEGGTLIIRKWVNEGAGTEMKGGTIIIKGDGDAGLGMEMEDGEIHVMGAISLNDYDYISDDIKGGRIYHGKELVWPKKV